MLETLTDADLLVEIHSAFDSSNSGSWQLADGYVELSRRGWKQQAIADEFGVSQGSVSRFMACAKNYALAHNRPPFCEAYKEVSGHVHVAQATGQVEWYTPPEYIEAARQVLGGIDLDPASSRIAQETVRARKFYTAEDDGLSKPWTGRVWLNPPYSVELVEAFTSKLCAHYEAKDVTAAILLSNNASETQWFQKTVRLASALCLPLGRVRFLDDEGNPSGSPLQGQAVVYFGRAGETFCQAFGEFGFCVSWR
jgi:ParB family chromosome partitioning protein